MMQENPERSLERTKFYKVLYSLIILMFVWFNLETNVVITNQRKEGAICDRFHVQNNKILRD